MNSQDEKQFPIAPPLEISNVTVLRDNARNRWVLLIPNKLGNIQNGENTMFLIPCHPEMEGILNHTYALLADSAFHIAEFIERTLQVQIVQRPTHPTPETKQ